MWSPFGETTEVDIPLSLDAAMYEHPRYDNAKDDSFNNRSWREPTSFDTGSNTSSGEEKEEGNDDSLSSLNLLYEDSEEFVLELGEIRHLLREEVDQNDATEVLLSLKALADYIRPENRHSQRNINEAFNAGAPHILVHVMQKWQSHVTIQTVACCCMFYLAYDLDARGDVIAKARRMDIAKAKGLEAVVTVMKTFPNSKSIQFAGCGAMMKLITAAEKIGERRTPNSAATNMAVRNATRRCVQDLNGIAVLTESMNKFPDYGGLQSVCCEALDKLASHDEFKEATLMTSSVVAAVATTLEIHGEDESCSVREHATCFMLKSMMAKQRKASSFKNMKKNKRNSTNW